MEVEFDKEIDALLKRGSGGRTITIGEFAGGHPDADEIAAFVERAIPENTRAVLTNHFAECDPCRKVLSSAILIGFEEIAAPERVNAAAPIAAALPWYRRLFQFPQLAYTLGGLVVLFAGFIGVSVVLNTLPMGAYEMSRSEPTAQNAPVESQTYSNSNAASSAPIEAANATANSPVLLTESAPETRGSAPVANTAASNYSIQLPAGQAEDDRAMQRPVPRATVLPDIAEKKAKAEEPAPDVVAQQDRSVMPARENEVRKETLRAVPAGTPPPPPPKAVTMAPGAPRDKQAADASPEATKSVGANRMASNRRQVKGKTFEFRQGAWYDTTYRGQGTINVRRNTEDYRKLDGGLKSLAESFIGTVVTIWNGKAYKID
ncbi:MAG: hypothetical protein AB7Q37_02160 [Pyrinomonadaceae bacterium]